MITLRKSEDRGRFDHGWLDTRHTFSFADYQDPKHVRFRSLRVINEDFVQPGKGFGTHGHRDMEILTFIVAGALRHQDSMGNGSVIRPGDVQRMTAGTGVMHSEVNATDDEVVHLYQIWILPESQGLAPSYEQVHFSEEERRDQLRLIASRDGRAGSVTVHQDAEVRAALLSRGASVSHDLAPGRDAWLQVIRGHVTADGRDMRAGDGAAVTDQRGLVISAAEESEILLFDLASPGR